MGWLWTQAKYYTNMGHVDKRKEMRERYRSDVTVLKDSVVGDVYYSVVEYEGKKIFDINLVKTSTDPYFNFGYKSIGCDTGFVSPKIPKGILDLLRDSDDENIKAFVKANDEIKKRPSVAKLPVGTRITVVIPNDGYVFKKGTKLLVTKRHVGGRKHPYWMVDGTRYKISGTEIDHMGFEICKDPNNVKDWYMEKYPTDELGKEINETVTFDDIYKHTGLVYELLGVGDSVVRERVFGKIAELYEVNYSEIYNRWLNDK